jgi:hypothetical protein
LLLIYVVYTIKEELREKTLINQTHKHRQHQQPCPRYIDGYGGIVIGYDSIKRFLEKEEVRAGVWGKRKGRRRRRRRRRP